MNLEIKKAKFGQKLLLILGISLFTVLFIYVTFFQLSDSYRQLSGTLFFIAVISSVIRHFYIDRLQRFENESELIDFWLFYINGLTKDFTFKDYKNYFLIIPVFKRQDNDFQERIRTKVNSLSFLFYATMIGFVVFLRM